MSDSTVKILYVSHSHPPDGAPLESIGGMQRVSMQLLDAFRTSQNVEVVDWVLKAPWKGIGRRTAWFLMRSLVQIPRMVRREGIQLIWFSSMVTASLAPRLRHLGIPMLAVNHGQDVTLPVHLWQRYLPTVFNSLGASVSVSEATRQQCLQRGLQPDRAHVLPNGIDNAFQSRLPGSEAARSHLGALHADIASSISEARPLLLTVGRLMRRKGHAWFLREVLPRLSRTPVHYLVVGEGPELAELQDLASICVQQTPHRVTLLGRQADEVLHSAYVACDLFIMPNIPVEGDMEGFGVVLLEANLSGTPAIASDLEGIRDVIVDGVNGVRVPARDAGAFSAAISELLEEPGRRRLGTLSRESSIYVQENFLWERLVERYITLARTAAHGRISPHSEDAPLI